jgi:hypothetical protein
MAEKIWLLWHDAVPRVPSTREHGFSRSDESKAYEHVCLVTANSGSTEYEPVIVDVLLLAAAVEFCDRTLRRPSGQWARNIVLQLPVYCVDRWTALGVSKALMEVLQFLTGDVWRLKFNPRKLELSLPLQRPLGLPLNASAVIPYSDGLDSWAVATICGDPRDAELIRVRLIDPAWVVLNAVDPAVDVPPLRI